MQLTIDTSSKKLGITLSQGDRIIEESMWYSQENHTRELIPGMLKLLRNNNATIHDVDCIFVAKGPGSFNGLRVGMSVAKGLAFASNIPLIGISTLSAEAYLHAASNLLICPLHEAGRGEVAAALFQMNAGKWKQIKEEEITTIDQLPSDMEKDVIFCGEISARMIAEIKSVFGEQASISPFPDDVCRASIVTRLGFKRLAEKDIDNPAAIQPLYLRRPPITRPKSDKHFIISASEAGE